MGVFVSSRCTLMTQNASPPKRGSFLRLSRTTRENMNGEHTASFKTARPLSNWACSHRV